TFFSSFPQIRDQWPLFTKRSSQILLSKCLDFILENLRRQLDKICMFALPVSESEAPGYFSVIKTPICLQEMSKNIRKNSYSSIFDLLVILWNLIYCFEI
ncbi:MAG: hypothetical protein MHMPM18_003812, partial [Marteilia pararefringens]